jgi:hypothetical protein
LNYWLSLNTSWFNDPVMKCVLFVLLILFSNLLSAKVISFNCTGANNEQFKIKKTSGLFKVDRVTLHFENEEKVTFSSKYKKEQNPTLYYLGQDIITAEGLFRVHHLKEFKNSMSQEWNLYIEDTLYSGHQGNAYLTYFATNYNVFDLLLGEKRERGSFNIDMHCAAN